MFTRKRHCVLVLVAVVVLGSIPASAEEPRFVQVEEGLFDTETGIVWGHHFHAVTEFLTGQGVLWTWSGAMAMTIPVDGVSLTYQEFSNLFYGRTDDDWRVPTRDELVEAINAGLMMELDISPAEGIQLVAENFLHGNAWSSTEKGPRAYSVNLYTSEPWLVLKTSAFWGTIPVRGGLPDEPGGKGNGKGNK